MVVLASSHSHCTLYTELLKIDMKVLVIGAGNMGLTYAENRHTLTEEI